MKRKILVMIAAVAAVLVLPLVANAATVEDLRFYKETGSIIGCKTDATGELVIPEEIDGVKVTEIGYNAFNGCKGLTSITIPEGVTNIGDRAFYNCGGLASVKIPDGVAGIGSRAFYGCSSLESISTPNSVTIIEDNAFTGCSNLTSVNISDGVTSIGVGAFEGCGSLNISVSPNNPNYCDIDGVLYSKDKNAILGYAKDKIQQSYIIPDGVISIEDRAFNSCSYLTSVIVNKETHIANMVAA